jgi:hypothetical protein
VRRRVKASFAAPIQVSDRRQVRIGLVCLMVLGLVAFLGIGAPSAGALDTCPNVVFRTGPSAKLPDCRAYELVTPVNETGIRPTGGNAFNEYNSFEFPSISESRDSVIFETNEGTMGDFPGNGYEDRYRSKRTATGWVTEYFNPTPDQTSKPQPGGVAPDHSYEFVNAGSGDFELEPESTLQAPFGGHEADYLRKPNGEYELIGRGSLGSAQHAQGLLITPGGKHILFISAAKLEPLAQETSEEGFEYNNQFGTIYDRSPGGPTKVVSLMPDGTTPPGTVHFVGTSTDAADVSFSDTTFSGARSRRYFVRHANTQTKEWARAEGVQVGQELTCSGGGEYKWLRNGVPIGGATNATYTTTAADESAVLQCQVIQTNGEGSSIRTSSGEVIVAPFTEKEPPSFSFIAVHKEGNYTESGKVGDELTCDPGSWAGNPTFTYQWFRNGSEIAGATSSTYTLVGADKGSVIECRIIGTNGDGTVVGFSGNTARIAGLTPSPSTEPVIANVSDPGNAPEVGDELSCTAGTWANSPTFSYGWLRNGLPIGGATSSTYTLVAADEGASLQCTVTGTNAEGATEAVSDPLAAQPAPATTPPVPVFRGEIFGNAAVGSELFATEGSWSGEPTLTYQWLRNGTPIAGATSQSYTPSAADVGSVIQMRIMGTNAGGGAVAINASQAKYVTAGVPNVFPNFNPPGIVYAGTFNGQIFYGTGEREWSQLQQPGDLFSYDIATGTTTRITSVGDALFSNVSSDGSTVYFISKSEIGGEGAAGEPNLYMWSRSGNVTKFVATVSTEDLDYGPTGLASWTYAISAPKEETHGLGNSNTRSTAGGSALLFETVAQLTSFDNEEATAKSCNHGDDFSEIPNQRCTEIYRYDAEDEELTCISCGEGPGPATGEASMKTLGTVVALNPPANLSKDGKTVVFETTEGLVPQDGNGHRDVYRWKEGSGVALISTGQSPRNSNLYGVSEEGDDILFTTQEQLLPQDENGGTPRIYDARVDGGFAPPESTVTEPCTGDTCQGNPSATPEPPQTASSSLNGGGNVPAKPKCSKGRRLSVRSGKARCVKRRHRHHHRHAHRRAGAKGRASR